MLGELKDWTVSLVIQNNEFTSHAYTALFCIAFAESSFFPIPPDIPFIMMGIVKPELSLYLALLLSIASVLGGALGYFIGFFGGRPLVEWMVQSRWIRPIFNQQKFEMVEEYYQKYDVWAVLVAAFTPIPYKVFTIGGGVCRIHFWRFMLASLIGRSGRFFLVGSLMYLYGDYAKSLVQYFDVFLVVMLILVVLGFAAMKFLYPAKKQAS